MSRDRYRYEGAKVTDTPKAAAEPQVVAGQLLVYEKSTPTGDGSKRYELWTVKSVRALKSGDAKVTLLMGTRMLTAEATATFPEGVVRDPFRLVEMGQQDLEHVWKGCAP